MATKKTEKITQEQLIKLAGDMGLKVMFKTAKQPSINEQKLAKLGLHAHYEHYRFPDKSAITECMNEDDNRAVKARGFSICSHKDNFCKADGRIKSLGRAMSALEGKKNMFPVDGKMGRKNEAMFAFSVEVSEYLALYLNQKLAEKNTV